MNCTQKQQLVCFPKVRVYKPWFRHFNDHKDFRNEGTVHLFSLMALFSYANFRSNERVINGDRYMEAPGQWICKLGALPRILRVHSKAQALKLMEYFRDHGFLTFEILDEEKEILRFTIADWKEHCTHLQYNYYSYKGSGFFFFPLPVGRLLLKTARKEVGIVFSELDAIMDMWLHTILNDPKVRGSEYMPVVYYSNMRGMPLLSYTYLARRWGWSKSRVGRFMLKAGEYGIISRVSFSSSRGSVISMCRYAHMHAQGEEQADGIRAYSCIGVVLQDYSNGTGDKTVRVTANLSPGFFPFVLSRMQNDLDRFDFTEDKIFGEPDEHGLSTVTKLSVKRASVGNDGKPRNYPWCVIVENGRAVKEKTATGGTHIKSGTYKKQRSVYVNINDLDFFNLVYRTTRFIESWELTYGPKLIRDARKLLSEQRAAAQQ